MIWTISVDDGDSPGLTGVPDPDTTPGLDLDNYVDDGCQPRSPSGLLVKLNLRKPKNIDKG